MENYVSVGRAGKTHGIGGELKFFIEDEFLDDFLDAPAVFLTVSGKQVPFFIESVRGESNLIIKLEEVDSREVALPLAGAEVFLREQDVSQGVSAAVPDFAYLEGFTIWDAKAGEIGAIEAVMEFPQQLMAALPYKGKEILIPLNDQFIRNIDQAARRIDMELPEGLLGL